MAAVGMILLNVNELGLYLPVVVSQGRTVTIRENESGVIELSVDGKLYFVAGVPFQVNVSIITE